MSEHRLSRVIDGFHLDSFHAGATFAAAEVVSLGCKKLALSSPYTDEDLTVLLEPTRMAAEEYGLTIYVENDLLVTRLYDPVITKDKSVILIARDQRVIDEYLDLKKLREKAIVKRQLERDIGDN
ncbi:MAG: hypothetical protein GY847_39380 [Proteobacteria bacterium]|nr:hypothetical protein [Pseudomonadota bacterium]